MDVSNGRIDNSRLGRAANLREVGEESGKILDGGEIRLRNMKLDAKRKEEHTRNRPLRVSRLWRSTALCVARRSAVLARREGLRLVWRLFELRGLVGALVGEGEQDWSEAGRDSV